MNNLRKTGKSCSDQIAGKHLLITGKSFHIMRQVFSEAGFYFVINLIRWTLNERFD